VENVIFILQFILQTLHSEADNVSNSYVRTIYCVYFSLSENWWNNFATFN